MKTCDQIKKLENQIEELSKRITVLEQKPNFCLCNHCNNCNCGKSPSYFPLPIVTSNNTK